MLVFFFLHMASLIHTFLQKTLHFFLGFWVFFSNYPHALFRFINQWILRLKGEYVSPEADIHMSLKHKSMENLPRENINSSFEDSEHDVSKDEDNKPESFLVFRFPRYEEFIDKGSGNGVESVNSKSEQVVKDTDRDDESEVSEVFYDQPRILRNDHFFQGDVNGDSEADGDYDHSKDNQPDEQIRVSECIKAVTFSDENDFEVSSDTDSDSAISSSNFSLRSSLLDSMNDGFLSDDDDFRGKIESRNLEEEEEAEFRELSKPFEMCDSEEDEDLLSQIKNIENDIAKSDEAEKGLKDEDESNDHEEEGMETQWEHQELIEQLKMEIGKVKATGLPTIFEDSETPKMGEDLELWKIDEKLYQVGGGTMDEVHKFYKSYRERMRKFDIFNYQKMYAIGFLRLKDPLQSFSAQKISLATIVSQDCWPCKPKSSSTHTMVEFTRELESDLETIYVGQLCLSWEFLCWEYGKALALWDSDPHETRRYNNVAAEFQQFQVLLQRFLEDEPFRGSTRVHNFVKNRCVHRRLLQVPVIREDNAKDRMKQISEGCSGKDAVTSVMLVEMIEASIRLLWQLIRTDKDTATNRIYNCKKASRVDPQNPEDAVLLIAVQEGLRKKQKKLKEVMRSDCCLLKKLQRNKYGQSYSSRVLCFFSQVDMNLVSRVLNMRRMTTDQLAWCSSKLDNIDFVDNQIRRESSFFLFPCN